MELMQMNRNDSSNETRDTLLLVGGVALVVFGSGLILASPLIRQLLGGMGITGMLQGAVPDVQRYFKLKAM